MFHPSVGMETVVILMDFCDKSILLFIVCVCACALNLLKLIDVVACCWYAFLFACNRLGLL